MRAGLDACVHCGFCLQSCPTYIALENENDSPRGRIVLMRSLLAGSLAADDGDVATHIDRCLGCRACETACPSGVPYGRLLEATRATLALSRPISLLARTVLLVFARRTLLNVVMFGARVLRATRLAALGARLPGRIGFSLAMLDATRVPLERKSYIATGSGARGSAALLDGCVMDALYKDTNQATSRALAVNDYAIVSAPGQGCCGALHAHAGDLESARALARTNVAAFENSGARYVAVNAAGCGAMMKEYGHLLAEDPAWAGRAAALAERIRDVSELLADAGPVAGAPLSASVAYDAPCHLLHAQRISAPPLKVLAAIPGLDVRPLVDSDQCCGAAGIYNLVEPDTSRAVLAPKLRHIANSGAGYVVTGNPGCLMQIGAGLRRTGATARAVHPVDLLDASYSVQRATAP